MKITFLMASGFTLSGGDRVIAQLAQQLENRGHEVFVISRPRRRPNLREHLLSILRGRRGRMDAATQRSHFDALSVPHRLLERYRPVTNADVPEADVVVATWWETAEWAAALAPSKGAKAFWILHHEVFDYLPRARVAATYTLPLHKIAISPWLADLMTRQYGDPCVSLIQLGLDLEQFDAPPRARQTRPTVGMLYATPTWKGCAVSLHAFSLAAERLANLQLIAFGEPEPTPALPLPPGAEYIQNPAQSSIKDIYARCDVWLCGSWSEGFHLPPLEAMACRCPVVSTRVGGPQDLIQDGINGYLVLPGDSTALAEGLVQILSQPQAEWLKMSKAAYATARQYTWERATDSFEDALRTAIERSRCDDLEVSNSTGGLLQTRR